MEFLPVLICLLAAAEARNIFKREAEDTRDGDCKCDSRFLRHYAIMGCTVDDLDSCGCPRKFSCPQITNGSSKVCKFRGQEYPVGSRISHLNPCQVCRCQEGSPPRMSCVTRECPELPATDGDNCHPVYAENKCCPQRFECLGNEIEPDVEAAETKTCKYGDRVYPLGAKVQSADDPCLVCVCDEHWFGEGNRTCAELDCVMERHRHKLDEGCVPVYHEGRCCPIEFYCPASLNDGLSELPVLEETNTTHAASLTASPLELPLSDDANTYQDPERQTPLHFTNQPLPMQAVVPLNAPPGTPVFKLQARDPEHDIHYFLVRDNSDGRFEVDESSGEVRTLGSERFVLGKEYVLHVRAEDSNGTSTGEERLSIMGGRRPPQFLQQHYDATIPENQPIGASIIEVKAKSFDDREIRYELRAQGRGAGTFKIGPTSGVVTLAKDLDYEDPKQPKTYYLIVSAMQDFKISVELIINVTDVDENAPRLELPDNQPLKVDEEATVGTSTLQADRCFSKNQSYAVGERLFVEEFCLVCYCIRPPELVCVPRECPEPPAAECIRVDRPGKCCPEYECMLGHQPAEEECPTPMCEHVGCRVAVPPGEKCPTCVCGEMVSELEHNNLEQQSLPDLQQVAQGVEEMDPPAQFSEGVDDSSEGGLQLMPLVMERNVRQLTNSSIEEESDKEVNEEDVDDSEGLSEPDGEQLRGERNNGSLIINEIFNIDHEVEVPPGCPTPLCEGSWCKILIPEGHHCPTCVCKSILDNEP